MVSAVTKQGLIRFAFHTGSINAERVIDFMDRLIADAGGRQAFLILDNLRVHHAKPVKEWLAARIETIEVFYLPAYNPEAKPNDYLNRDLKTTLRSQAPKRFAQDLRSAAHVFMEFLEKNPARVRAYFNHSRVSYAA